MNSEEKTPLAIFRSDASPAIGAGHVTRCLTLADALVECGWRCAFACRNETVGTVAALANAGHAIETVQSADDTGELQRIWPTGCDLLVVDHYQLDSGYEAECRDWAKRILVIDDLADRPHDCDILLDQTYGRRSEDYDGLVPGNCLILAGSHYALLRPQFAKARYRALSRRTHATAERVLVSLGATDAGKVVDTILDGIASSGARLSLDVIGNERAGHPDAVFHSFVEDMAALMSAADFAIGAGGISAWERCCLGLPSVMIITADNQRLVARNLTEVGAVLSIGDAANVTPDQIADAVETLASDDDIRHAMSHSAAAVCDGLGAARTVMAMAPEMTADGSPVRLAPASMDHGEIIYQWQATPEIRQYFRNPEPPERDHHFQWLEQRLSDPACVFNLVLCDEKPSGFVHLEHKPESHENFDTFEVSILIAPGCQGMGLGKIALNQARYMLPDARLTANIRSRNDASKNLFLNAGYKPAGGEDYWSDPV